MKTNIFLPQKINVGFQERKGTYTGKLAYIIYFDEKGKLRKEASWNGWRDKELDNIICDNEPTSGFVLNKKAGGYNTGWNHRQTYVRVYDPRGFEFEIGVSNLLYILENTNSIKGKGLDGEFVYGWDGKDLVLIPTDSPDYKEISELNKIIHENNFIKAKELKLGATYIDKNNENYIYLGKFEEYDSWSGSKKKGKSFFFARSRSYDDGFCIDTVRSVSKKFISCSNEECVENYASLMDLLECNTKYSPIDDSKDLFVPYTYEEFIEKVGDSWVHFSNDKSSDTYRRNQYEVDNYKREEEHKPYFTTEEKVSRTNYWGGVYTSTEVVKNYRDTLKEIFDETKPFYRQRYLANGKFYGDDK